MDSVISDTYFFIVSNEMRESDLIRCEKTSFSRIEFFRKDGTISLANGTKVFS